LSNVVKTELIYWPRFRET